MTMQKKRVTARQRILIALKAGRRVSLYNSAEFKCSEFHTEITYIRRLKNRGMYEGWELRDKWVVNQEGIRYKEYWFEAVAAK